jgi:CubicO group peptidase (beta-lactamase class C family)
MPSFVPRVAGAFAAWALIVPAVLAQAHVGEWRGEIAVPGAPLAVVVHLTDGPDGPRGTIDIPAQGADKLPLVNVSADGAVVGFEIADTPGRPTFRGTIDGDTLAGTFTQGLAKLKFTLRRAAAARAAAAAAFADLQGWLDATLAMFDVPGAAIAVVKSGELLATFASGKRDLDSGAAVDADTLFAIGSSTKAFTTCLLAMLVDDGALEWDEPVRRWLPEFALADAAISERITPRDLVTHRSGMPRHDAVWYGAAFDRAEMVARLRHLPLKADLRAEFLYNNLMYLAAGHLAERIADASWEDLVRERILEPLGMARTVFTVGAMERDANHALPYRREKGMTTRMPFRDITAIGPAGSINSSAREMANWVRLQLGGGVFGERRLLSAAQAADLHVVRMPMGGADAAGGSQDVVSVGYALGWMVDVYRGHRRVHHGGNIDGFSAQVALLPAAGWGFVVLCNQDASPLPDLAVAALCDLALGLEPRDERAAVRERQRAVEQAAAAAQGRAAATARVEGTTPSRQLAGFAGDYEHPGYGRCRVGLVGDGLRFSLHGLEVGLMHWHYDVFAGRENDGEAALAGVKVQFLAAFDGAIEALRVVLEPQAPPIVFARLPDARLGDPEFLARLAGSYALETVEVQLTLQGDRLVMTLPGQRHELEPASGLTFRLRGVSGYSVEFVLDDSAVRELRVHQPDGTYVATPKPRPPK